jgi:hypothetical protein
MSPSLAQWYPTSLPDTVSALAEKEINKLNKGAPESSNCFLLNSFICVLRLFGQEKTALLVIEETLLLRKGSVKKSFFKRELFYKKLSFWLLNSILSFQCC